MKHFEEIINSEAAKFYLDPQLVTAIIMKESSGNPFVCRYEPKWKYAFECKGFAYILGYGCTEETERLGQMTSWGLMQVMGTVARELGFRGWFSQLCDPAIGINYGCKKLRKIADRYASTDDIISAYNAGSAIKNASGFYSNQSYVDEVFKNLRSIKSL